VAMHQCANHQWLHKGTSILLRWALTRLAKAAASGPSWPRLGRRDEARPPYGPSTGGSHSPCRPRAPWAVTPQGSLRVGGCQCVSNGDIHMVAHEGHGNGGGSAL